MAERIQLMFEGSGDAPAVAQHTTRELRQLRGEANTVSRDMGRMTRGVVAGSGAFRGLGRAVAFASAGFLSGAGLAMAVRGAVSELVSQQRAAAQTDAVLKSTGGTAGVTASQIDGLARSLMRLSGVDDENIKQGENWLLTFREVRNEAGKGNDIFNQAVKAALDLAAAQAALHGTQIDMASASTLVGRALNDPISGLTALRRIGVSFTEQQRDQIKTMMAAGDIMGAQKVVLHELSLETAGAAKSAGDTQPWNRLRETIRNLSASLLEGLSPSIRQATDWLQKQVDAFQHSEEAQREVHAVTKQVVEILKALVQTVKDFVPTFRTAAKVSNDVADALGGWQNVIKGLIALKLVSIVRGWTAAFTLLAGSEAAAGAAGGAGLAGAAGRAALLLRSLTLLARIGTITIIVDLILNKGPIDRWFKEHHLGFLTESGASLVNKALPVGLTDRGPGGPPSDRTAGDARGRTPSGGIQNRLVSTGKTALGVPYQYGGAPSLSKPTDCSGLMVAIFAKNGIALPRTSQAQYASAPIKNARPLAVGDLVFSEGVHPGHVGLYIGDGDVLEDPHTGDHVKIIALSGFGWNGESARWWGGKAAGHGATGATTEPGAKFTPHDPDAFKKKPKKKKATAEDLIPADLREAEARAKLTKTTSDDIKAQQAIIDYLDKRIATEKNRETRIRLIDELADRRARLAELRKGKGKEKDEAIIPPVLEERLARAELTKRTSDDIAALKEIIAYLTARAAHEKNINKRIEILGELKTYREKLAALQPKTDPLGAVIGYIGKALTDKLLTDAEVAGIDKRLGSLNSKLANRLRDLTKTIVSERDKLGGELDKVRDTIMSAFDERVVGRVGGLRSRGQEHLARATAVIQRNRAASQISTIGAGGLTWVMQKTKDLGDWVIASWEAFVRAVEAKDQGAVDAAMDQLASAQAEFDSISGEMTETEQAYLTAWQTFLDAEATVFQQQLDEFQAADEAKMRLAGKAIRKDLDKIFADVRAGKITWQAAQELINQLLAPFGLSLADLGDVLDTSDLEDALGEVSQTLKDLQAAIDNLAAAIRGSGDGDHVTPPRKPPIMPEGDYMVAALGGPASTVAPVMVPTSVTFQDSRPIVVEVDGARLLEVLRNESIRLDRTISGEVFR